MKKSEILKIFNTDETKVELFGDKKNGYCWRKPGERFNRNFVKPTLKHGGGCIMVWGGISAQGQSRSRGWTVQREISFGDAPKNTEK
jgi:hypothetical protein